MKLLLWVVVAGMAGTLLRFGIVRLAEKSLPGFPWGTLIVNVLGAFFAGFLFVCLREKFVRFAPWFPVVFLGFLGAFTTFSTFALESSRFLLRGEYGNFFLNVALQNGSGIAAAAVGMLLATVLCCR